MFNLCSKFSKYTSVRGVTCGNGKCHGAQTPEMTLILEGYNVKEKIKTKNYVFHNFDIMARTLKLKEMKENGFFFRLFVFSIKTELYAVFSYLY